ncbi:hypothetical protein [Runella slithyformis]|uniref:Uncharacterized protein n=1 Tax=Runella slithyformis (strain ATCC 29530 / DSM 19594 / LMG 11500 / NCIMB 11436 / LSU 4) TaxID=761193 RepID=A0A7U3ZNC2_RUNSL|nr:hypothetical protein [Runella slithyformis]AEI50371.1 hypothetical protein Runsl_4018 [Runella slithyformis DSM 19594]
MNRNLSYYLILAVLVVVDAWLLAHPNLIGRLGILFFKYDMIKTFPRALATVSIGVLVSVGIVSFLPKAGKQTALLVLGILTMVSIGVLVNTIFKFSSGSYAMTGAGFKTGAILMPIILVLVFGNGLMETAKGKKA